jgi:putative FmdB family regulatory protein
MPIYEYRCEACGHAFEKLIRNAGDLPDTCPECGRNKLKKQFSSFAAKVAGGGCRNADSCAAAAAAAGHRHSGGCCGTGGKCPL